MALLVLVLSAVSPTLGGAQLSPNSAKAITDILTVISSERSYAGYNCGFYANVYALESPEAHIPSYPWDAPFIDPVLTASTISGHNREWHPNGYPPLVMVGCDCQSVLDYCYTSTPLEPGEPSFAGTADGTLYIEESGAPIACPVPSDQPVFRTPELISPAPGSRFPGHVVSFIWTAGDAPVTSFQLRVGSERGSADLLDTGPVGQQSSITLDNLPTDGRTIYARLDFSIADRWNHIDIQYKAARTPPDPYPALTAPEPGSQLSGASVTLQWTPNQTQVSRWSVISGSMPGQFDYFSSGALAGSQLSVDITGLPSDGSVVYTRLYYYDIATGWWFRDFQYISAYDGYPLNKPLFMYQPLPGSELPDHVDFDFIHYAQGLPLIMEQDFVRVGSSPGSGDYYTGDMWGLYVTGLPKNGDPVYVRIWCKVLIDWYNSVFEWKSIDYAFGDISRPTPPRRLRRPRGVRIRRETMWLTIQ